MTSIEDLSDDVLIELMLKMEPSALGNFCQTSSQARNICSDEYFWRLRLKQDFGLNSPDPGRSFKDSWVKREFFNTVVIQIPYYFIQDFGTLHESDARPLGRDLTPQESTYFNTRIPQLLRKILNDPKMGLYIKNIHHHKLKDVKLTPNTIDFEYEYSRKYTLPSYESFKNYIDYILLQSMEDEPIPDEVYDQHTAYPPYIYLNLSYDSMRENMYSWRKKDILSYDVMRQRGSI